MNKKLKVALCTDKRGCMLFGGKRVSSDRLMIKDLCDSTEGKIYISEYSLPLFKDYTGRIAVCVSPIDEAEEGGTVFTESPYLKKYGSEIEELTVYNWNRIYPYDEALDIDLGEFKLISVREFQGHSHEKITKGIYRK